MIAILETPWLFMWLLAGTIFFSFKALTWRTVVAGTPLWASLGYWFAWPGLDAAQFLRSSPTVLAPRWTEWTFAAAKLTGGAACFWLGGQVVPADADLARGWIGMIGIIFLLHFGLFHVLSCYWRSTGRDAPPIMDHPWAATSVADFWGRRWNRAFRDVAHRFMFRPLARIASPLWAMAIGFFVSGLLHEAVITAPAGGGYGGPTLYFAIQAIAVGVERAPLGRRLGLGHGLRGRFFAAAIVLGPVGLLFPPVFVRAVIVPMMDACGAA